MLLDVSYPVQHIPAAVLVTCWVLFEEWACKTIPCFGSPSPLSGYLGAGLGLLVIVMLRIVAVRSISPSLLGGVRGVRLACRRTRPPSRPTSALSQLPVLKATEDDT